MKKLILCKGCVASLPAMVFSILLQLSSPAEAQPIITNTTLSTSGMVLSGTGGTPSGTYWTLTSPHPGQGITNWLRIDTNTFDGLGNFSAATPLPPGVSQQFFAIQEAEDVIDFSLLGYDAGTTGGAGGPTQTVSTAAAFETAAESAGARVILVDGTLGIGTVNVKSDKTIIGANAEAALMGNLKLDSVTNIIIRNLHISNFPGGDGITVQDFSHHIWIDHCSFGDCGDGQLDITHGSDFITVSWCTFTYTTAQTDHRFSSLVGHNADNAIEDAGKLRVTYHHNWWGTRVRERTPRVRFGKIHAFNNYFFSPGNNYCIRTGIQAEVLSENNYFKQIDEPYDKITELGETGLIRDLNNIFENCSNVIQYNETVFTPPYPYSPDPAGAVPDLVTGGAGRGQGPFAP